MKKIIRVIAILLIVYCSLHIVDYGRDTIKIQVVKSEIKTNAFLPQHEKKPLYKIYLKAKKENNDILQEVKEEEKESKKKVDFLYLNSINQNIIAYLSYDRLGINYPVVSSRDNKDYLHTDLYGNSSYAGSLFLDCTDTNKDWGDNHLIYGHNMKNCTMFGMLGHSKKDDIFYIYLPDKSMKYKVIDIRVIEPDDKFYSKDRQDLKNTVSLSTCKGDKRLVVTGKRM